VRHRLYAPMFVLWRGIMTCTECATPCEAIGDEPYIIFICPNCGQIIDPEKAICVREEEERFWS